MRIDNSYHVSKYYGTNRVQQEALVARSTKSEPEQIRIAKNSENRIVLLNLAMNKNISEEAVEALFARKLDYLTSRLENLGYEA